MNIITLDNISRLVDNIKTWVTVNFTPSTNGGGSSQKQSLAILMVN